MRAIADGTPQRLRLGSDWYLVYAIEHNEASPPQMISRAEAERIAGKWVRDSASPGASPTPEVYEFDLGYVVWARPEPDQPPVLGAGRGIIDRYTGELSVWPALPVEWVIARYRERQAARPPTLWTWEPADQLRWDQRHLATPANVTQLRLSGTLIVSRSVKGDPEPRHHPLVVDFFRGGLAPEYRERGYDRVGHTHHRHPAAPARRARRAAPVGGCRRVAHGLRVTGSPALCAPRPERHTGVGADATHNSPAPRGGRPAGPVRPPGVSHPTSMTPVRHGMCQQLWANTR